MSDDENDCPANNNNSHIENKCDKIEIWKQNLLQEQQTNRNVNEEQYAIRCFHKMIVPNNFATYFSVLTKEKPQFEFRNDKSFLAFKGISR